MFNRMTMLVLGIAAAQSLYAQDANVPPSPNSAPAPYAAGQGSVGIEVQNAYYHGDFDGPAGKNSGDVRFLAYELEASYFVADGWEIRASLPYIKSKFGGPLSSVIYHPEISCLTPAGPTPACRPTLLDNGQYHGSFQDWDAGVRYHFDYDGTQIAPGFDLVVPSHNYAYYGDSIGQRNTKFGIGVELSHQFDFSNFFYQARYEYFFNTPHLGYNNNYNKLGLDVGDFFSPALSAKLITDLKVGNGITDQEIGGPPALNPIWLNHDRFRLQDHGIVGAAVDYVFGDHYDLQTTLEHAVWGRSNGDLKYEADIRLTRSF